MAVFYDVKDFGALGDGVHDDTAAIQAAIDAASAAEGGEVYLSAGTYNVSAPAQGGCLLLRAGVFLVGDGLGDTVIRSANPAGASSIIRGAGDWIGARDLTLDGNDTQANARGDGWNSAGHDGVFLQGVEVYNARGHGFDLRSAGRTFNMVDCVARSNGGDGVITDGQVNSFIHDSASYDNGNNGFALGGELQLLDSSAHHNGLDGIQIVEGDSSLANTSTLTVDGGTVYDNAGAGVHAVQANGFVINGVDVHGNQSYGIHVDGSRNGLVTFNNVYSNSLETGTGEIWIEGFVPNPAVAASNVVVTDNIVTGGPDTYYGIVEIPQAGDYNLVADNVISQVSAAVVVSGEHSEARNNVPFVRTYGTDSADRLTGALPRDQLYGGSGNDVLDGAAGDDVLIGGAGVDRLTGGSGADVFRFTERGDSYRTATGSHADLIRDFTPGQDRIDVSALGFTGLGNGHGSTLKLAYNAGKDLTYLKSFEADSQGQRFELALAGHITDLGPGGLQGFEQGPGSAQADSLFGGGARDSLAGLAGDDRLFGGAGGDTLSGGSGADTFVYRQLADSLRADVVGGTVGRDTLTDFDATTGDQIDLSALGFTGLGNGSGDTLKVVFNSALNKTVLRNDEQTSSGEHFEILLQGDQRDGLSANSVIFTPPDAHQLMRLPPGQDLTYLGSAGRDVLVGNSGDNLIQGGDAIDRLRGGVGDDVLVGGRGADLISGDTGDDIIRFSQLTDSYRQNGQSLADSLFDFSLYNDRIDVSALGFIGLGDGHDGTLQVTTAGNPDRTFVRSLDEDAQGRRFEVRLYGDYSEDLQGEHFIFASAPEVANIEVLGTVAVSEHSV